jgi:hypothetical protein
LICAWSCVLLAVIVGLSLLFVVTSTYVIFGHPTVFSGAAGLLFSCRDVCVI